MARKKGSTTKKKCWRIKVVQGEDVLFQKEYSTLAQASDDLDMTYCQLFELAPNGRSKKIKKHKFAPEIIVEKITPLKKKNNTIEISENKELEVENKELEVENKELENKEE